MSIPTFQSPCTSFSSSCSDRSLTGMSRAKRPSSRRRRKVDATIEYYRLVPGQYRNVPEEAAPDLHLNPASRKCATGVADSGFRTSSPIYATAVDIATYRSSFAPSRARASTNTVDSTNSSSARQSKLSVHHHHYRNFTPTTSIDVSPLNREKPLSLTPASDSLDLDDDLDRLASSGQFSCGGSFRTSTDALGSVAENSPNSSRIFGSGSITPTEYARKCPKPAGRCIEFLGLNLC
jgi:hypothetical protein